MVVVADSVQLSLKVLSNHLFSAYLFYLLEVVIMSKPNKFRRKPKKISLGKKETPRGNQDPTILEGRSVRNPLFHDLSATPASPPISGPPSQLPQGQAPLPNRPISAATAVLLPHQSPLSQIPSPHPPLSPPDNPMSPGWLPAGQAPNRTSIPRATNLPSPAVGQPPNRLISPIPPGIYLASPAAGQPPSQGPNRSISAGQPPHQAPNRFVSPVTSPPATNLAGPTGGQPPHQAPNRFVSPATSVPPAPAANLAGPTGGQPPGSAPSRLISPVTSSTNLVNPAAGQPLGQAPNRFISPVTSATNLVSPAAAGQPPGQASTRIIFLPPTAGQPPGQASTRIILPPTAGQQRFQSRRPYYMPQQGVPYVPPVQTPRHLPQDSPCSHCRKVTSSIVNCVTLRHNRPFADSEETDQFEDEKCFHRCRRNFASQFSLDCCYQPQQAPDQVAVVIDDGNIEDEKCFHRCRRNFASQFTRGCCHRPQQTPDQITDDDDKCFHRCSRNFASNFSLGCCYQPQETPSPTVELPALENTVVIHEIAGEAVNEHTSRFSLLDCCCQPKAEATTTTVTQEAALFPDEEEPVDCGCSLAACLDLFCYQPQIRTVPSPYNPEEMVTVQQNTHRETVIVLRQDIVVNLYLEVKMDFEKGLPDEEYEQSCSQRCDQAIGYFCEGPTCKCPNPFSEASIRPKKEVMTKTLLKAKKKGYRMIRGIGFSFLEDFAKHIFLLWVIPEFILGLIGFLVSIATVSLQQNEIFNILHLSLITLATGFATIDFFETLFKTFKHFCKRCGNCTKKKVKIGVEKESVIDVEKDTSEQEGSDEVSANEEEEVAITEIGEVGDDQEITEDPESSEEDVTNKTNRCSCYKNKCRPFCKSATDAIRIILTEVILYPLLICDIFEVTTGRAFESSSHVDRLGAFLFIVSCIYFILYVYVARIVILVGTIRNVTGIRTPERRMENKDARNERYYNRKVRKSAIWYQTSFAIHMVLQMLAQVLMLIAIGAKIRYDNRHLYRTDLEDSDDEMKIRVSGHLWFMIISGYFLPFMGFLSFFVVTFYWSQEFPIGIYVDMISLMKMTACGGEDVAKLGDKMEGGKEDAQKIASHFEKLDSDFHTLRETTVFAKLSYPFKKPGLIIICMIYTALLLSFVLCASLTVGESGDLLVQILNGGGWVIYYLLAIVFGIIANLYVLLVVALWVIILAITVSIVVIAIAILSVTMWCYFACLCYERHKN